MLRNGTSSNRGDSLAKVVNPADKEKALAALMDAPTLTAAAEKAGIARRTLYNYLRKDSQFAWEYKRQRELRAIEQAEQAAEEREAALQVIRDVMNNDGVPAAVRLKAAVKLLDMANAGDNAQRAIAGNLWDLHNGWSLD